MTKKELLKSEVTNQKILPIFVAIFSVIAIALLVRSFAADNEYSLEPELASINDACIGIVDDSSASGGQAVEFNCSSGPNGFVHPGISASMQQLDFVKSKIQNNEEPWLSAFNELENSTVGKTSYSPKATTSTLKCSTLAAYNSGNQYCANLRTDAGAVYSQALMWYFTGNQAHADKAIQIMKNWSSNLQSIPFDDPNQNSAYWQGRLEAGWATETMLRGAEIIKHTNAGWSASDLAQLESMFKDIIYPNISQSWSGINNTEMTWSDALMSIGVFLDDRDIYDEGLFQWKRNAKALTYLNGDGTPTGQPFYPISWPKYKTQGVVDETYDSPSALKSLWKSPSSYIEGLASETCRDLGHTMMGLGAMSQGADIARIQGTDDLFDDPLNEGRYKERFLKTYELNARYINEMLDEMASRGWAVNSTGLSNISNANWQPSSPWVCPDFKTGGGSTLIGTEIAYNNLANRLGNSMPETKKLAERTRQYNRHSGFTHLMWETLTHANNLN